MKKSYDDKLKIICLFHGLYEKQRNKSSNPFVGLFVRFLNCAYCLVFYIQFDQESGRRRTTLWMCNLQIIVIIIIIIITCIIQRLLSQIYIFMWTSLVNLTMHLKQTKGTWTNGNVSYYWGKILRRKTISEFLARILKLMLLKTESLDNAILAFWLA